MNEKEMLDDCIALTQNFISQYYQRKIDFCLSCLDKDFVFIGPYNFQQSHGKNEFMKIAEQQRKGDKNKVKINISHKHYSLIERNAYLWIIECSYYAHTTMKDGRYLLTKPRCTFIWKRKKMPGFCYIFMFPMPEISLWFLTILLKTIPFKTIHHGFNTSMKLIP